MGGTVLKAEIIARLYEIEARQEVRILYAAESGSRAWGFASPDSDYDVRFIYQRSVRSYLRLSPPRDVIEIPIQNDLDINGWDILKALHLFRKSNPTLMEWLLSPTIYVEKGPFASDLRALANSSYSRQRAAHHYVSMARNNYRTYIEDKTEVWAKKYLYVLRPLLCVHWIEQYTTLPPTAFDQVVSGVTIANEIQIELSDLLHQKRLAGEMGITAASVTLNSFILAELERLATVIPGLPDAATEEPVLNQIAWRQLGV